MKVLSLDMITNKQIAKALFVVLLLAFCSPLSFAKDVETNKSLSGLKYSGSDKDSEADLKALKTELLVKKSEKNAILQLKRLIRRHRGRVLEVEFQHRLGELYMRRAKGDKNLELHRHSDYSVSVAPKLIKKASSKRFIRKAIKIFGYIQVKFKKFHRMDLVVFNNAFANHLLGNVKSAEKQYWKLIRSYPNSPLVPDSHLAIGEMAFGQKRFKFALKHFNSVKKYPNSRVYPYSVYKAGWTRYNLRDEPGAIKEMEEVVRYGKYIHDQNIDARLDLRREALSDMTIFYEDVYLAKDAYSYFKKQSGELDVAPTLFRLSKIYERHSRYVDRMVVLDLVVENMPLSAMLPKVYEELVLNFEKMRKRTASVRKLSEFNSICAAESRWVLGQPKVDKKSDSALIGCVDQLRDLSLKLAEKWLRLWDKNKHHIEFANVSELAFQIFLKHDTALIRASKARFAYADLLFKRKKYRKASKNYAVVGKRKNVKGKLGHDSRYAALLSLEKAVKDKWSDEDENNFHVLAKIYLKRHPKGKYILDIEFKKGLIAYEKENFTSAAKIFLVIGDRFSKETKGKKAQDLYLDILNLKKDYKALVAYSSRLIGATVSPIRKLKLNSIFEQSSVLQIQDIEESGKLEVAAKAYQKFALENPKSKLAGKSWWNSVELQYKAGLDKAAADSAVKFSKLFPRNKNVLPGLFKAAKTYEGLLQLKKAANILEILVKKDPKSSNKWLSLAADFRMLSNDGKLAKKLYTELSKKNDANLAAHALEQLAIMAKNRGLDTSRQVSNLIKLGVEPQASFAHLKNLEAASKIGDDSSTFIMAKKLLGRRSAPSAVKAKARFIQANILEREFRRQSVRTRIERVSLVLSMKTEKLEKVQRAYQAAIRYGDGNIAVDSLRKLAGCYSHYSKALNSMPPPKGLPAEEVASFQAEISKLAIPIEEKGLDTLNRALSEAKRLRLRSGVISKIQIEVDRINMRRVEPSLLDVGRPEISLPTFAKVGR